MITLIRSWGASDPLAGVSEVAPSIPLSGITPASPDATRYRLVRALSLPCLVLLVTAWVGDPAHKRMALSTE